MVRICGARKPVIRSTVGSGAVSQGRVATGSPKAICGRSKCSCRVCASCVIERARDFPQRDGVFGADLAA